MTAVESSGNVGVSSSRRDVLAVAAIAPVAAVVVLAGALIDRATVSGQAALTRVGFGHPLDWLMQDRTTSDPRWPAELSPASPWDNPTSIAVGPLVVDVLVVYLVLVAAWFIGRAVLRRATASSR